MLLDKMVGYYFFFFWFYRMWFNKVSVCFDNLLESFMVFFYFVCIGFFPGTMSIEFVFNCCEENLKWLLFCFVKKSYILFYILVKGIHCSNACMNVSYLLWFGIFMYLGLFYMVMSIFRICAKNRQMLSWHIVVISHFHISNGST
jgi:hypothetical protein